MTYQEMIDAINNAEPGSAVDTAIASLAEYDGDDKELIEPDILEMAIVADTSA